MYFGSHVFENTTLLEEQINFLLEQFSNAAAKHYDNYESITKNLKDNKEEL